MRHLDIPVVDVDFAEVLTELLELAGHSLGVAHAVVVVTACGNEERELLSSLESAEGVAALRKPFAPNRLFSALARAGERRLAS